MTTFPGGLLKNTPSYFADSAYADEIKTPNGRFLMRFPNPGSSFASENEASSLERQHALLLTALENIGAKIERIESPAQQSEMMFTSNAGLIRGKFALISNSRYPARQAEEPCFRDWFERNGYRVQSPSVGCRFEGEGDAQFVGDMLVCGYAERSGICSHRWLSETLALPAISVQIVDADFPRLDSCLFPLDDETVAYYPKAFDAYGQVSLRNHFDTIEVTREEALAMACSSIVSGKKIVMSADCPILAENLETRGYEIFPVEMSEFAKQRRGCKSLVLRLN